MGKVIIIVWKWNFNNKKINKYFASNNISNFNIEIDDCNKLIGFTQHGKDILDLSDENKNKIKYKKDYSKFKNRYTEDDIIMAYKDALKNKDEVLLLLHENENESGSEIVEKIWQNLENNRIKGLTVDKYGGGKDERIYGVLLTSNSYTLVHDPDKEAKELKEDFKQVWKNFSKSIKEKIYEQLKTEFIKLWLPIAIDMQGLYEVKEKQEDNNKFEKYLGEIKNTYEDHFKRINNFHKENEEYFKSIFDIEEVKWNIIDDKGILKYYQKFPEIFEVALKKFDEKIKEEHKK